MPAVADWIMQSLVQGYLMSMVRTWLTVFFLLRRVPVRWP
jgi:hypothetical protein